MNQIDKYAFEDHDNSGTPMTISEFRAYLHQVEGEGIIDGDVDEFVNDLKKHDEFYTGQERHSAGLYRFDGIRLVLVGRAGG